MVTKIHLYFILIFLITRPVLADPIPYNFAYTKTNGEKDNLLIDKNTYIFVEFFATWCESCRFEMATLEQLNSILPNNIVMKQISISPDTDSLEKIIEYKEEFDATWEFGVDSDDFLADLFDVATLPSAILFDPEGYRLKMWVGITELSKFINDINIEVSDANIPLTEGENKQIQLAAGRLISNPLFLISSAFIVLSPILIIVFNKIKNIYRSVGNVVI